MAITGVHALLYSSEPDELRRVLSDVLGFSSIDSGGGWLIYALPPTELGVHPGDAPAHELSIMCDDINATKADLEARGITFEGDPVDEGFGIVAKMLLPGGVEMLLYEPRHDTAI